MVKKGFNLFTLHHYLRSLGVSLYRLALPSSKTFGSTARSVQPCSDQQEMQCCQWWNCGIARTLPFGNGYKLAHLGGSFPAHPAWSITRPVVFQIPGLPPLLQNREGLWPSRALVPSPVTWPRASVKGNGLGCAAQAPALALPLTRWVISHKLLS